MKYLILNFLLFSLFANAQTTFENVAEQKGLLPALMGAVQGSGVAAADFDNDGDIDLFLCTEKGEKDRLYLNQNGSFTDVSVQVGLNLDQRSRMAIWLDYDGDANLDLLVAGDCGYGYDDCAETQHLRLFRQSAGMFYEVTAEAGLSGFDPVFTNQTIGGLASGDINNDGYIDFVEAVRNGKLYVFKNTGTGSFVEVSKEYGITSESHKYYQPLIMDLNKDGLADIYCNIDFGENLLYLNQDHRFSERSKQTNTASSSNEMGIALGDYDNDDDYDIYITNIADYQGKNTHNLLLKNELQSGQFTFEEVSKDLAVGQGGWGWGTTFFDADNDGWLDLAATNGWSLPVNLVDQTKFWYNLQAEFEDRSELVGLDDTLNAATLISLDFDRDGDLDLVQTLKGHDEPIVPFRLMENLLVKTDDTNFLVIKPRMNGANHFAIGSTVKVYFQQQIQTRAIISGSSFYGQEPYEAFFGLGNIKQLDSVEVIWPGGDVSRVYHVDVNTTIEINDSDIILKPSQFRASIDISGIQLNWNDCAYNETGYKLLRSKNSGFTEEEEIILPENSTFYYDQDVRPNNIYYYRLQAFNNSLESLFTKTLEIPTIQVSTYFGESGIKVYPNPIRSTPAAIQLESIDEIEVFKLFNVLGEEIGIQSITKFNNIYALTLGDLENGIYFLIAEDQHYKLIVNR